MNNLHAVSFHAISCQAPKRWAASLLCMGLFVQGTKCSFLGNYSFNSLKWFWNFFFGHAPPLKNWLPAPLGFTHLNLLQQLFLFFCLSLAPPCSTCTSLPLNHFNFPCCNYIKQLFPLWKKNGITSWQFFSFFLFSFLFCTCAKTMLEGNLHIEMK